MTPIMRYCSPRNSSTILLLLSSSNFLAEFFSLNGETGSGFSCSELVDSLPVGLSFARLECRCYLTRIELLTDAVQSGCVLSLQVVESFYLSAHGVLVSFGVPQTAVDDCFLTRLVLLREGLPRGLCG
jgi:hypothetical protein